MDVGYKPWGMNPALVIEMLQKTISNFDTETLKIDRTAKRSNDELLAELKTPTQPSTK